MGFVDVQNAYALEPGGAFNFGAVNASLYEYTGDIDYQHIPEGKQELAGKAPFFPCASLLILYVGLTLVGRPADSISALYVVLCLAWLGLKAPALAWLETASGPENLEPGQKPAVTAWLGLAPA